MNTTIVVITMEMLMLMMIQFSCVASDSRVAANRSGFQAAGGPHFPKAQLVLWVSPGKGICQMKGGLWHGTG